MHQYISKDKAELTIKFDSKLNQVRIGDSKIKNAGQGLFARKHIHRSQPLVVYYGTKITDKEVYDMYIHNLEGYHTLNPFIRGTPNGFSIIGEKSEISVLQGAYVNDIACINCSKDQITKKILQDYANTIKQCNLRTVDTLDYPIYYTTKSINKGEELYVHYGIGYWLLHIGCRPEEISKYNEMYDFESLYPKL